MHYEEPPDTTPPTLVVPSEVTVDAVDANGGPAYFFAFAFDDRDFFPLVTCEPPSGSVFPIGTSTVSCTATDSAGNTATQSFRVTVLPLLVIGVAIGEGSVDPSWGQVSSPAR